MTSYIETTVTFKITGDALEPDEVTTLLGINPSESHRKGDKWPTHPEHSYTTGYWGLESSLSLESSLIDHLDRLFRILLPQAESIRLLGESGMSPCFYCGISVSDRVETSVLLEPDYLRAIAEAGCQLQLQFYVDSP